MSTSIGRYKDYYWLKSESIEQSEVVDKCTSFLIDKYLAITAFDSGPISLSSEDREAGWKAIDGIAYSPKLTEREISNIPQDGFDEWYFLESDKPIKVPEVFVNYVSFDISGEETTKGFWEQIESINPYAYIAGGNELTIVTKDKSFIDYFSNSRLYGAPI